MASQALCLAVDMGIVVRFTPVDALMIDLNTLVQRPSITSLECSRVPFVVKGSPYCRV